MDAIEKVTGRAQYTADIQRPGMLHAAILRAPVARGRVTELDLSYALALDGVRGGVTIDNVPDVKIDGVRLFDHNIQYANQPIAALCADTLEIAQRALNAIVLEIDVERPVVSAEQASSPDAPRVKPDGKRTPRIAAKELARRCRRRIARSGRRHHARVSHAGRTAHRARASWRRR
jgi:CO/xanthine dehydrogenase Mo-binding subunit